MSATGRAASAPPAEHPPPSCSGAVSSLVTWTENVDSLAAQYGSAQDVPDLLNHIRALAAENARLRQERDRALTSFESLEKTTADAIKALAAETRRADSAWDTANSWHGQWAHARAKVEVLRHRDRCTQAVVEAAKAWRKDLRQFVAAHHDGVERIARMHKV